MLLKLFCELVFAHDWRASAYLSFNDVARAERERLAWIAQHDDECGYLWELAIAVFGGENGLFDKVGWDYLAPCEAQRELREFLEAWDLHPIWRYEHQRCREPRRNWRFAPQVGEWIHAGEVPF
jgi:hypothetical protein